MSEGLVDVPGKKKEVAAEPVKQADDRDKALEDRFNNLKGQ